MKKKSNNTTKLFRWAIAITVIYIGGILYLTSTTILFGNSKWACNTDGFLTAWFGCLYLNEFGDFLAGAFAPVAFLWVAVAVIIQSLELNAQRIDLRRSQKGMKQNRKVMKLQAKEAKKQAKYIGKQTDLLVQEQKFREDAKQTRIFEKLVDLLDKTLRFNPNFASVKPLKEKQENLLGWSVNDFKGDHPLHRYINAWQDNFETNFSSNKHLLDGFTISRPDHFMRVFNVVQKFIPLSAKIPGETDLEYQALGVQGFHLYLCWIVSHSVNFEFDGEILTHHPEKD